MCNLVIADYKEALAQFGPNFPKVQRLQAQIAELDANIQREKQNIIDTLDSEYRAGAAREMMLGKALEEQKKEVNEMAGKMVEYNILKRDAEANKTLYDGLDIDVGQSGASDSRPQLNLLMGDARKRQFDAVVVWRFDRFARSTKHLLLALEEFRSLGIQFISYGKYGHEHFPWAGAIHDCVGGRTIGARSNSRARQRWHSECAGEWQETGPATERGGYGTHN